MVVTPSGGGSGGGVSLYIDGASAGDFAFANWPGYPSQSQPLYVGNYPGLGLGGPDVTYDDIRFYHIALSQAVVSAIYNITGEVLNTVLTSPNPLPVSIASGGVVITTPVPVINAPDNILLVENDHNQFLGDIVYPPGPTLLKKRGTGPKLSDSLTPPVTKKKML